MIFILPSNPKRVVRDRFYVRWCFNLEDITEIFTTLFNDDSSHGLFRFIFLLSIDKRLYNEHPGISSYW
jgi:hypothetical protein